MEKIFEKLHLLQRIRRETGNDSPEHMQNLLDKMHTMLEQEIEAQEKIKTEIISAIGGLDEKIKTHRQRLDLTLEEEKVLTKKPKKREILPDILHTKKETEACLCEMVENRKTQAQCRIDAINTLLSKDEDLFLSEAQKELASLHELSSDRMRRLGELEETLRHRHEKNTKHKADTLGRLVELAGRVEFHIDRVDVFDKDGDIWALLEKVRKDESPRDFLETKKTAYLEEQAGRLEKILSRRALYAETKEKETGEMAGFLNRNRVETVLDCGGETEAERIHAVLRNSSKINSLFDENKFQITLALEKRISTLKRISDENCAISEEPDTQNTYETLLKKEANIEGLEKRTELIKQINTLYEDRNALVAQISDFEKNTKDPERLFKASFRLLKEEKHRKTLFIALRKKTETLRSLLAKYKATFHSAFTKNRVSLLQTIEEADKRNPDVALYGNLFRRKHSK
ncbi:MAG: uncharacterized protein A8A55_0505 [Amphiamblys sp. WSBS2006]|nr:MAG: uncharacterized protein A8A55_0505 [Amphiamblys sp. WSBS2006]